jgi:transposase InsO family protein
VQPISSLVAHGRTATSTQRKVPRREDAERLTAEIIELARRYDRYGLREAQIIIESWRRHYNAVRPHVSLGYKPPALVVFVRAIICLFLDGLDVAVVQK